MLVVEKGKIVAVGPTADVKMPAGANKIDVAGRVIMPGLVDTHSHIGGSGGLGGADGSGPIQPGVRILRFDQRPRLGLQASRGRRTDHAQHHARLRPPDQRPDALRQAAAGNPKPKKIDDLFILDADGTPLGGLKMANGTNSMHDPPFPGTRGKSRVSGARAIHQGPRVSRQDRRAPPAIRPSCRRAI